MDTNLLNNYVLKAINAYPYDLEETVENLNYALSYDSNNTYALYLMGRLHAEELCDYEKAKEYFAEALTSNLSFLKIYGPYIKTLLQNGDYTDAQKLIDFSLTVKGMDKSLIWCYQGLLFEHLTQYKRAIKAYKTAKTHSYNDAFISFLKRETSRVKNKIKPKAKKHNKRNQKNKK